MTDIKLHEVKSSQIHSIGYDEMSQTLAIRFLTADKEPGPIYHYSAFPVRLHNQFRESESLGKFFGEHIKGKFLYSRVGE